jgi:uncharacterized SAM-binding protein YcdF (DUF218 family)
MRGRRINHESLITRGNIRGKAMFFLISKTIGAMFIPSNLLIAIGSVGLIFICSRYRSLGRKLLVVCVAGFIFCGFSPVGYLLLIPIETRFPTWSPKNGAPDGIVVLGGGIDAVIAAAKLVRQYPRARVVYSGGNPDLFHTDDSAEADVAESQLLGLGLERDRLLLDRQARNTQENAEFAKAVALPKPGERWLLVTAAYHMPRSVGIFRKVRFAVEPYPLDHWKIRDELLPLHSTFLDRLRLTDLAVREWIGLLAYRLAGRTSELLPSPEPKN